MEAFYGAKKYDPGLPSPALRLLVPPLRLLSAAMWQVAKQRDVMNYDLLQEYVFTATEAVPGIMAPRQRAELLLGLRARLILELCKGSSRGSVDAPAIQSRLDRLPVTPTSTDGRDAEVERTEATFVALVQSLLKDPAERAYFFQEVFPVEYGPKYDGALHKLLWELLSKLEKLFPVPDLKQTADWLDSTPSIARECIQTTSKELSLIYQYHKSLCLLKTPYGPSSTIGSCIMSALSIPPSQKTTASLGQEAMHNYANITNPMAFAAGDHFSVVTVYTEVEVEVGASDVGEEVVVSTEEIQIQEDFAGPETTTTTTTTVAAGEAAGACVEHAAQEVGEAGESGDIAKALETLTKTFALKNETLTQGAPTGVMNNPDVEGMSVEEEEEEAAAGDAAEGTAGEETREGAGSLVEHLQPATVSEATREVPVPHAQQSASFLNVHKSTQTRKRKQSSDGRNKEEKMDQVDVSMAPSVIAIKGMNTDGSGEMTSIIFTCPQCPFYTAEENSPPHIHIKNVPTEEYRALTEAKRDGAEFAPSPGSADQIFTSIKLLPKGSSQQDEPPDGQSRRSRGVDPAKSCDRASGLVCETCGRKFTRTSDVRRHQLTHTGERPFRCSRCDRTFQHSWDLAKHETKHHGAAISFRCQLCGSSFTNLRSLSVHHKKAHSGESRLPQICSICSRSFATSSLLLEHRKSHGDSLRYTCQQCGEGFDTLLARSQHRQAHHVTRQFKCLHCDKTYTRRSDVKRHQATHTGEQPYQCGQCSKRFSLRFMLMKHLHVHTGERPFQCSYCPKRFTLDSILARHERMHTGEKPFLCSQCGKGFLSQGELSKHHRSHVDDKPYACTQCDKCFKSKKAQQEHIFSHSGARPYPCGHCGKGFTKIYALTRHNLIHTGERPFPCSHCDKTFLTHGEARLHQRIHTGERPYACTVCQLKFKSTSELGRHKRSHSATKASKPRCQRCGMSLASKAKLRKHMEAHTEDGGMAHSLDSQIPEQPE